MTAPGEAKAAEAAADDTVDAAAGRDRSPLAERLVAGGVAAMVVLAGVRIATGFAPRRVFDVDPAVDPAPMAVLGPGWSLALDGLLLLAAATALFGHARARRGANATATRAWILAALPLPALALHAAGDLMDLVRGAQWTAAIVAGLAAWTVVRTRPGLRRACGVALVAAAMLPFARGLLQSEIDAIGWTGPEHAQTVAAFERDRDEVLAARGWAPGGPSALIFERRLRQPQPRGWFETTNVLATLAGAAVVAGLAWGIGSWRERRAVAMIAFAIAAGGLGILAMSDAKGAGAATLAGGGALVLGVVARRGAPPLRAALPWLVLAAPVGVLTLVAVRGALLPEDFAGGERSVLFRWHYQQGAAAIIADAPLAGVGPDGFQAAYVRHRPPRSPEEPASPHAAWLDWTAAAGVGGLGWVALSALAGFGIGRVLAGSTQDEFDEQAIPDADAPVDPRSLRLAVLAGTAIVLAVSLRVEGATVAPAELFARLAGGAFAGLAAFTLVRAASHAGTGRWVDAGLAAAAVVVLCHGQIELTPTRPGSAAWCALLVASAAAGGAPPRRRAGAPRWPVVPAAVGLLGLVVLALAAPVLGVQGRRIDAAAGFRDLADARAALAVVGGPIGASDPRALEASRVLDRLGLAGRSGRDVAEALARLEVAARDAAADALVRIEAPVPDVRSRVDAIAQWRASAERLAAAGELDAAVGRLQRVRDLATPDRGWILSAAGPDMVEVERRRATLEDRIGRPDDALFARELAARDAGVLAEFDPRGAASHRRLAEVLAELGAEEAPSVPPMEVRAAAQRIAVEALELDADRELDPLKRLPDEVRRRLEHIAATGRMPGTEPRAGDATEAGGGGTAGGG